MRVDKLKGIGDWRRLLYWRTGEWQVVKERLNEATASKAEYNPGPGLLFAPLRSVLPDACRVAIVGQDPYPRREHCMGLAFSVPPSIGRLSWPPTLVNLLKEYEDDLGYPTPKNGDLTPWCEQGVLLWNAFPSCAPGKPGSHHWDEWTYLTREIIDVLNNKELPISWICLGKVAADLVVPHVRGPCIVTSHPSPLGVNRGFRGSRVFSRTNLSLERLGLPPINWRLP